MSARYILSNRVCWGDAFFLAFVAHSQGRGHTLHSLLATSFGRLDFSAFPLYERVPPRKFTVDTSLIHMKEKRVGKKGVRCAIFRETGFTDQQNKQVLEDGMVLKSIGSS